MQPPRRDRPDRRAFPEVGGAEGSAGRQVRVARVVTRMNVGGPARHCLLLGEGLRARGFETVLYTGALDPGEGGVLADDVTLTAGGLRVEHVPGLTVAPSPRDDLRALWHLVRAFRRQRPDVVHTHTSKAGALGRLAAALAGVPVVVHTFHGHVLSDYFAPLPSMLVRLAERALAKVTTRIVTLSPALRGELAHRFRVAGEERIEVVPLGRDLSAFERAPRGALRRLLGLGDDALLVGTVARLAPIKRVPLLVDAFARVAAARPQAHLVVVGDGPERAAVEAAVRATGLAGRVHLIGWRHDLPAVYGDLDLVALSSRNEGTPLTIVEAFAAGVPVVATQVGGVGDMFSPIDPALPSPGGVSSRPEGALVPPEDPRALAAAIDRLLADPVARADASAAARVRARAWSGDRLLDDMERLYRDLLAARG